MGGAGGVGFVNGLLCAGRDCGGEDRKSGDCKRVQAETDSAALFHKQELIAYFIRVKGRVAPAGECTMPRQTVFGRSENRAAKKECRAEGRGATFKP
jgi:hypothetical protein